MLIAFLPRRVLARLSPDRAAQAHLNILLSSTLVLVGIVTLGRYPGLIAGVPHFCLAERLLGLPCPGCGMVRALTAIPCGRLVASCHYNAAAIPFFALCCAQVPIRAMRLAKRGDAQRLAAASRIMERAALTTILVVWVLRLFH